MAEPEQPALFEALIVPHRSLSVRGMRWVIGLTAGLSLLIGMRFWFLGAWPVLLFSVAEAGLVLLMLHLNMRQTRSTELVLLTESELRIVRTGVAGARSVTSLSSAWLSVVLEERGGRVPRLLLRRHGLIEEIGGALGADAKRDLAAALTRAMHRARNPVFDHSGGAVPWQISGDRRS